MIVRLGLAFIIGAFVCSTGAIAATPPSIKDPVESKVFAGALRMATPVAQARALEAFAAKYPKSVALIPALDQAMSDYQDAGQTGNMSRVAAHILDVDPSNLSALVTATYLTREAASDTDPAELAALDAYAVRGLAALDGWTRSASMPVATYTTMRAKTTAVFYGALAYAALSRKDFAHARDAYLSAFAAAPNAVDAYQLGTADLQLTPLDPTGFWYVARSVALLNAQGATAGASQVEGFGRTYYTKYHGSADGWDAILTAAATQVAVPSGFAITPKT